MSALTFAARSRLTRPEEFREANAKGRRLSDAYFSLLICPGDGERPRLGLAVATRIFGTAVARNRIKRLIRESFRLNQYALPAVNVVVRAREQCAKAEAPQLRTSLEAFWRRLGKV